MKKLLNSLMMCLGDGLIPLDLIPSGSNFYSSGSSSRNALPPFLTCFAVVSASTRSDGVSLGDHEEAVPVVRYFMPSTLRKSNPFLAQGAKIAVKTKTVIPIDRFLW